jgi:uncharacterized SAM-binding protein YcdF (DUF218 family)
MFLFKKIAAPFLFPLSICAGLLLIGVILLWFSRKQSLGKLFVTTGTLMLLVLSYDPVPTWMLRSLESRFAPAELPPPAAKWIVVLGGGHVSDDRLPATSQLSPGSMMRLVEGIRLSRLLPDAKVVLSGGSPFGKTADAVVMANAASILGVPKDRIVLETKSRDTEEQAILLRPLLRDEPFLLITSASHMPRSMMVFRNAGLKPMSAPTDFSVKRSNRVIHPGLFFPSCASVSKAERATYEYLGMGWAKILDKH